MAGVAGIPRSRGSVCGLLLILLGAWGGLIPFVGPYFHYAYTPDKAWAYTTGRLYLEVVPGAVALLGGLIVLATRSRAVGGLAAFLAALGGVWFVVGTAVTQVWAASFGHVTPGVPAAASAAKSLLEALGFFTGLGIAIVFFGALAMGRFSMIAARDALDGGPADYAADQGGQFPASQPDTQAGQYPATSSQFPTAQHDRETAPVQFPTTTGQFSPPPQQPPGRPPFPPAEKYPPSDQFPTSAG